MPREGGRKPGAGRPKGAQNKTTRDMKRALYEAFEAEGGVKYLRKLAQEEPRTFGSMLGKLIPQEVKNEITGEGFQITINKVPK